MDLLGSVWRISVEPKNEIKVPFSQEAPRSVPGRDLGPICGGFGKYFDVVLDLFSLLFVVL